MGVHGGPPGDESAVDLDRIIAGKPYLDARLDGQGDAARHKYAASHQVRAIGLGPSGVCDDVAADVDGSRCSDVSPQGEASEQNETEKDGQGPQHDGQDGLLPQFGAVCMTFLQHLRLDRYDDEMVRWAWPTESKMVLGPPASLTPESFLFCSRNVSPGA